MAEDKGKGAGGADRLSMPRLAEMYGFASETIGSNKELTELFQWAAQQGPDLPDSAFLARLKKTNWWQKSSKTWRQTYAIEYGGDATWEEDIFPRRITQVKLTADNLGVAINDEQVRRIARQSLYNGWDSEELQSALTGGTEGFGGLEQQLRAGRDLFGAALTTYESLKRAAEDSGLRYSDTWYRAQASRLLDPQDATTTTDVYQLIQERARSMYPALADQIGMSGETFVTVRDAARPYIETLAQTLELDPETIGLNDPLLARALKNVDSNNNAALMPLWKLEEEAIADDRWKDTQNGRAAYNNIADLIAETFGIV